MYARFVRLLVYISAYSTLTSSLKTSILKQTFYTNVNLRNPSDIEFNVDISSLSPDGMARFPTHLQDVDFPLHINVYFSRWSV